MFGIREDGPLRRAGHAFRIQRIRDVLKNPAALAPSCTNADRHPQVPVSLNVLECGCGGEPVSFLDDLVTSYTGTDFSQTGLCEAARRVRDSQNVPTPFTPNTPMPSVEAKGPAPTTSGHAVRLLAADSCRLPFPDHSFDAVYSAHMLYHIPSRQGQALALHEMLRVLRPGGVAVLVLANPRPFLFPVRFAKRLVADFPGLSSVVRAARKALHRSPPLPYKPMSIHWTRRTLRRAGDVRIIASSIPSTWFNRNISEFTHLGRRLWTAITWLERQSPATAARLGNYVVYAVRKRPR
jgi:SAM-dependent methyltransferase